MAGIENPGRVIQPNAKLETLLKEQNNLLAAILGELEELNDKLPAKVPTLGDIKALIERNS